MGRESRRGILEIVVSLEFGVCWEGKCLEYGRQAPSLPPLILCMDACLADALVWDGVGRRPKKLEAGRFSSPSHVLV